LKLKRSLAWQDAPVAHVGTTSVGSQTTSSAPVHDVRHDTLGRPEEVDAQHCAACPSNAAHCDESLQVMKALAGEHACELAAQLSPSVIIPAQQPSPGKQRVEPHATVRITADDPSGVEVTPFAESEPESSAPASGAAASSRVGGAPPCRSPQPEKIVHPALADAAARSTMLSKAAPRPKALMNCATRPLCPVVVGTIVCAGWRASRRPRRGPSRSRAMRLADRRAEVSRCCSGTRETGRTS
jgi:hypothetical protein